MTANQKSIASIKNALRRTFAEKANNLASTLSTLSLALANLSGDLSDQLSHVHRLQASLPPLSTYLSALLTLSEKCDEANIEENDFTTYTYDELAYELDLVKSSVLSKVGFLENQLVAREMTNLTPIQLEEFESVFRHFDREGGNCLKEVEFSAALASLGLVYEEDEMHDVFEETSGGKGVVTFEQFIHFMVEVTEDQNTAEQVFQSFREVADGKVSFIFPLVFLPPPPSFLPSPLIYLQPNTSPPPQPYVTELDLRHSLIPDDLVKDLLTSMPPHRGPDLQEDRNLPKFDYISFMEKMTLDENEEAEKVEELKARQLNGGMNGQGHSSSGSWGGGRRVSGNLA